MRSKVILKADHAFLAAMVLLMVVHEAMAKNGFMAAAGQFCTHLCLLHINCLLLLCRKVVYRFRYISSSNAPDNAQY
jgi:hypothetical protein